MLFANALTKGGFSVTKLSTTGGFLMAGNMTLLIGTDDEKVDKCIELIASCSKQRKEVVPSTASYGIGVTTAVPAGSDCGRRDGVRHQRGTL